MALGRDVMTLEHPASARIVFELNAADAEQARGFALHLVDTTDEIVLAGSAPVLTQPDLVHGVRALIAAFAWGGAEVRGVVRLLEEHQLVACDEAAWLIRWFGTDEAADSR